MMNDGSAYCPECFSEKPFFAPRCHACNEYIGFWYQLLTMYALWGTIFFGAWFFWGGFVNWFDQNTHYIFNWMVPVYFTVYILVPFAILALQRLRLHDATCPSCYQGDRLRTNSQTVPSRNRKRYQGMS